MRKPDAMPRDEGGFCRIGLLGGCKLECSDGHSCPVEKSGRNPRDVLIDAALAAFRVRNPVSQGTE